MNIFYGRFREKSMFLSVTYYFILTFSQWHLVNLSVEIHLLMHEIMQIQDLLTEFKLSQ